MIFVKRFVTKMAIESVRIYHKIVLHLSTTQGFFKRSKRDLGLDQMGLKSVL